MALFELLGYSEKLLQSLKLTSSIVEKNLNYLFEKCNYKYSFTIEFYYYPNLSLSNNNNTHIAALTPLPLTTHARSWTKLFSFGPKCTLPNPSLK